jgi:protein SCO1
MSPAARRLAFPLAFCLLGLSALVVSAVLVFGPQRLHSAASLIGGPFKLVAQDGRTVTDADCVGEPFLVFFGYTHCPDVCPTTLLQISDLLGKLGADKKVAALFVTVDPERDTPSVLKDYLSSFDRRIVGLSGDRASVEAAMKAYRVYAKKVPATGGEYSMDHTAIIYLMDKQGHFVSAFNIEQPTDAAAKELSAYL